MEAGPPPLLFWIKSLVKHKDKSRKSLSYMMDNSQGCAAVPVHASMAHKGMEVQLH